eukprot:scaffold35949_cov272-Skeletonema_dohrnii-CCMP3373.AAC.1
MRSRTNDSTLTHRSHNIMNGYQSKRSRHPPSTPPPPPINPPRRPRRSPASSRPPPSPRHFLPRGRSNADWNSDVSSRESKSIDHSNSDDTRHVAHVQRAPTPPAPNKNEIDNNGGDAQDNHPHPKGWRYSAEKQNIITCLKDPLSDVHLMTKEQIWRKYASNYDQKKTKNNLEYLLKQYQNKQGPFSSSSQGNSYTNTRADGNREGEANEEVEPWTTRKKKSRGWDLLYKLRLYPEKSGISDMTQEELWESSALFRCYPFQDFKKYDKKMEKLAQERRAIIEQRQADFERDLATFPPSERTNRDEPFWNRHIARMMLRKDVESGAADSMKPRHGKYWHIDLEESLSYHGPWKHLQRDRGIGSP